MVTPRKYPLLTALALAAYFVAVTAGGLLHDHAHHVAADDASHCGHHHHCHAAHLAADQHDGAPTPSHHDDDCAACRFLAQPVVPVAAVGPDDHHEASTPLAIHVSVEPVSRALRLAHARAPPQVG